jgi:hypothetical protein
MAHCGGAASDPESERRGHGSPSDWVEKGAGAGPDRRKKKKKRECSENGAERTRFAAALPDSRRSRVSKGPGSIE